MAINATEPSSESTTAQNTKPTTKEQKLFISALTQLPDATKMSQRKPPPSRNTGGLPTVDSEILRQQSDIYDSPCAKKNTEH